MLLEGDGCRFEEACRSVPFYVEQFYVERFYVERFYVERFAVSN